MCLCLCLLAASSSGSSLGQTLCVPREARHVLIAAQVASWLKVAQVAQVTNRFKFENAFCVCVCRTSSKGQMGEGEGDEEEVLCRSVGACHAKHY